MAKLVAAGFTDEKATGAIIKDNFLQYPTEESIKNLAGVCLKHLHSMNDGCLMKAITKLLANTAKQICLYAMMKKNRLVWGFMITAIREKYRILDTSLDKVDSNTFFVRLTKQDNNVASWNDAAIQKIKQALVRILAGDEYLDNARADHLNLVLIDSLLEERIRTNDDNAVLIASSCLSQENKEYERLEWASR